MTKWIDEVGRDVRLAVRRITRRPAVSIVIVACLGVGIGATSSRRSNSLIRWSTERSPACWLPWCS